MNDDVEQAQTSGSHGFPRMWGPPAGDRWSEERAAWIKTQVCRYAGQSALDELARRDVRLLNMLRRAALMSQRNAP